MTVNVKRPILASLIDPQIVITPSPFHQRLDEAACAAGKPGDSFGY